MQTQTFSLANTDLHIIDEDFIALHTQKGTLAVSYDEMLDLIAQFSQAVEQMDELSLERAQCPECNNKMLS